MADPTSLSIPVTRRGFLAGVAASASVTIFAACGGSTTTDTPQPIAPTAGVPHRRTDHECRNECCDVIRCDERGTTGASAGRGTRSARRRPRGTTTDPPGSAAVGTSGQMLIIEAVEYGFKTLGSIPAGVTTIQLKNLGKEDHEAALLRLNDGVTIAQFMDFLKQSGGLGPPPPIFTREGGVGQVVQDRTATVMLALTEGQYVLMCTVQTPDGQSHAAKGMVLPVQVTAARGAPDALPAGAGEIALGKGVVLPTTLPAGRTLYRVTNQGKIAHALQIGGIPAEKTLDDVMASLKDPNLPPWFQSIGGMLGLKSGGSGVVVLDLTPGKYAAVDFGYGPGEPPSGAIFTVG